MKEIPLTRGLVAIVDDEDFEELSKHKWHAIKGTCTFYVGRRLPRIRTQKSSIIYMHRFLLKAGEGVQVDHRDSNGLNNQRCNLRLATHSENQRNGRRPKNNTSGFKGVHRSGNKFRAAIWVDGVRRHIGMFCRPEDAHAAYCKAAKELHRAFARFE